VRLAFRLRDGIFGRGDHCPQYARAKSAPSVRWRTLATAAPMPPIGPRQYANARTPSQTSDTLAPRCCGSCQTHHDDFLPVCDCRHSRRQKIPRSTNFRSGWRKAAAWSTDDWRCSRSRRVGLHRPLIHLTLRARSRCPVTPFLPVVGTLGNDQRNIGIDVRPTSPRAREPQRFACSTNLRVTLSTTTHPVESPRE